MARWLASRHIHAHNPLAHLLRHKSDAPSSSPYALHSHCRGCQTAAAQAQARCAELDGTVSGPQGQLASEQSACAASRQRCAELEGQWQAAAAASREATRRRAEMEARLAQLQHQLAGAREACEAVEARCHGLAASLVEERTAHDSVKLACRVAEAGQHSAEHERNELTAEMGHLRQELAAKEARIVELAQLRSAADERCDQQAAARTKEGESCTQLEHRRANYAAVARGRAPLAGGRLAVQSCRGPGQAAGAAAGGSGWGLLEPPGSQDQGISGG